MCSSSSNDNSKLKKYFFFISFYSVTTNNNSLELYSIITWSGCFKFRLQKTCCGAVAPLVRFFLCVCFALFVCLGVVVTKNQRALFSFTLKLFLKSLWVSESRSRFWVFLFLLMLSLSLMVSPKRPPQSTIPTCQRCCFLISQCTLHFSALSLSLSLSQFEKLITHFPLHYSTLVYRFSLAYCNLFSQTHWPLFKHTFFFIIK